MKNPVSLWSATTVPLLLALLSFGCLSCKQGPVVAPARPAGVPQSAVWAGGLDGGSFIDCALPTLSKTNPCTVYDDYTGEVLMSATFILRVNSPAAPTKAPEFNAADGVNIFLTDGSTLEPGPEKKPSNVPKSASLAENGVYVDCVRNTPETLHCRLFLAADGREFFSGVYKTAGGHLPGAVDPKNADPTAIDLRLGDSLKLVSRTGE